MGNGSDSEIENVSILKTYTEDFLTQKPHCSSFKEVLTTR